MPVKSCSICNSEFECGVSNAAGSCWCNGYPAVMPADYSRDCQCPACLARTVAGRIDDAMKSESFSTMFDLARSYKDQTGLIEHIDYTIESGHYVFTRWYLMKRGYCCGNGCRNCPYDDDHTMM